MALRKYSTLGAKVRNKSPVYDMEAERNSRAQEKICRKVTVVIVVFSNLAQTFEQIVHRHLSSSSISKNLRREDGRVAIELNASTHVLRQPATTKVSTLWQPAPAPQSSLAVYPCHAVGLKAQGEHCKAIIHHANGPYDKSVAKGIAVCMWTHRVTWDRGGA